MNLDSVPNRIVGDRYVVLSELGRGGMGVVWRAQDRVIGRQVAMKEFRVSTGLTHDEQVEFRERLLREARRAGQLSHPGIVTVYDVINDGDVDYIVMELIEARTLAAVVASDGPLSEPVAASVALQMLSALQAAHEAGVVHRDIKPANVMLTADGRVKLTDFGIAHGVDDTRLTSTGMLVGSPGYHAPEQLNGAEVSPASDLWALGATLFYAVEGWSLFARDNAAASIYAVMNADIPTTRVQGPLGTVITGLLQRDASLRLTVGQAAALLEPIPNTTVRTVRMYPDAAPGHVGNSAPGAFGGARSGSSGPDRQRHRWWPWLAVGLAVGLLAGLAGGYGVYRQTLHAAVVQPNVTAPRAVTALTFGPDGDLGAFDVSEGECLRSAPVTGVSITKNMSADCNGPHAGQVVRVIDVFLKDIPDAYPRLDELEDFGRALCRVQFDTVVVGADREDLGLSTVVPTEAAYQTLVPGSGKSAVPYPNRDVYCVVGAPAGRQIQGSRVIVR
ncbi:MAG TPA: protein kinase [Pseudonocardia sp.]